MGRVACCSVAMVALIGAGAMGAVPDQVGGILPVSADTPRSIKPEPQSSQDTELEAIFEALTRNSWDSVDLIKVDQELKKLVADAKESNRDIDLNGRSDYHTTTYKRDGTIEIVIHSDYGAVDDSGAWTLQREKYGRCYLILDSGERWQLGLNAKGELLKDASPMRFKGQPITRPDGSFKDLKASVIPDALQKITAKLCGNRWKRANDLDLEREPTLVEFRPDFTYQSTYRNGLQVNHGFWKGSKRQLPPRDGKPRFEWIGIEADGPGGCDLRLPIDPHDSEKLRTELLPDGTVLINRELYVPEDTPLKRGVIWAAQGYADLQIRVEYDMPIQPGKVCHFDVQMTNRWGVSNGFHETLMLEGIKVLEVPKDYPVDAPAPAEVVLALNDLKGASLSPGETKSFSVDAKLPTDWFRLEVLAHGKTRRFEIGSGFTLPKPEWQPLAPQAK